MKLPIAGLGVLALLAVAPLPRDAFAGSAVMPTASGDVSAQTRRPRIRVTPRQPSAWPYPRPGDYSSPGPNAHRDCTSWLEPEWRPSGTVIVPRMRCWWVRG
jgi:hypothetical protein